MEPAHGCVLKSVMMIWVKGEQGAEWNTKSGYKQRWEIEGEIGIRERRNKMNQAMDGDDIFPR